MFRSLKRKRVWIPALLAISLGIAGWVWAAGGPKVIDPTQLPYTAAAPSPGSLHAAPTYGTRVRFEPSVEEAFERAEREDKLVLLLHLSGQFDSSETT